MVMVEFLRILLVPATFTSRCESANLRCRETQIRSKRLRPVHQFLLHRYEIASPKGPATNCEPQKPPLQKPRAPPVKNAPSPVASTRRRPGKTVARPPLSNNRRLIGRDRCRAAYEDKVRNRCYAQRPRPQRSWAPA